MESGIYKLVQSRVWKLIQVNIIGEQIYGINLTVFQLGGEQWDTVLCPSWSLPLSSIRLVNHFHKKIP